MFQPIHEFAPELKASQPETAKVTETTVAPDKKNSQQLGGKTISFKDLKNDLIILPKKVNGFIWVITSLFKEPSRTEPENITYTKLNKQISEIKENLLQIQKDIDSTKEQIKNYQGDNPGDIKQKNELIQSLVIRRREWRGAKVKLDNLLNSVKKTRFVNFHADVIKELTDLEKKIDSQFKDLSHMGNDLTRLNRIESGITHILRQRFMENELSIMFGDTRGSLTPHLDNLVKMGNELDELNQKHGMDEFVKKRLTQDKNEILKLVTKGVIEEREVGDVVNNVPYSAIRFLIKDCQNKRISKPQKLVDNFNNLKRDFRKIAYLSDVSAKMEDADKEGTQTYAKDRTVLMEALSDRFKELSVIEAKATVVKDEKLLQQIRDYKKEILKDPEWIECNDNAVQENSTALNQASTPTQNVQIPYQNNWNEHELHSVNVKEQPGLAVAAYATKPTSDFLYFRAGGRLFNEDSASGGQFADGTGFGVITDGEGGTGGRSDYWSFALNDEVGKALKEKANVLQLYADNQKEVGNILHEVAQTAFERAAQRMKVERPDVEKGVKTTLTFFMTRKIPGTNEKVVFGINYSDSATLVWDPKNGGFTNVHVNELNNLEYNPRDRTTLAANESAKSFKKPNLFYQRVPQDAKIVGVSDGVTDCFVANEAELVGNKAVALAKMTAVARNPIFDSKNHETLAALAVPQNETDVTVEFLKNLGTQVPDKPEALTNKQINERLMNYVEWKTSINRKPYDKLCIISNLVEDGKISQNVRVNLTKDEKISKNIYDCLFLNDRTFLVSDNGNPPQYGFDKETMSIELRLIPKRIWEQQLQSKTPEIGPVPFNELPAGIQSQLRENIEAARKANTEIAAGKEGKASAWPEDTEFVVVGYRREENLWSIRGKEAGRKLDDVSAVVVG